MIDFAHRGFQYGMANGEMLTGYFPESSLKSISGPRRIADTEGP